MKHLFKFILLFLILNGLSMKAQYQNANWYFGEGAGINFNSITPTVLNDGQTSEQFVATASVSDIQGNLIFYTDGRSVFDMNHNLMQNGDNSILCSQGKQSVVIVPIPNVNKYYIFTENADNSDQSTHYYFSIVDMDVNSGLGSVVLLNQSLLNVPFMDSNTGEYFYCAYFHNMTASVANDGETYWLIIKPYHKFYAFHITENIMNPFPPYVESTYGNFNYDCNVYDPNSTSGCSTDGVSSLKVSSNGNKIATTFNQYGCLSSAGALLYDFDNSTGIISNEDYVGSSLNAVQYFSVDFSANSQYLYCVGNDPMSSRELVIDRYYIPSGSNTPETIYITNGQNDQVSYSLQRALDGKLYIGNSNQSFLSCILNPNDVDDVVFQNNFVDLGNNISGNFLPQLIPYFEQDCPYNVFVYNNFVGGDDVTIEASNKVFATNTINYGANVIFNGGNSVVLGEFFKVENDSFLEIHTTGCSILPPEHRKLTSTDSSSKLVANSFDNDFIQLYPNPNSGLLNYDVKTDALISISIIDYKSGIVVKEIPNIENKGVLDLTSLNSGLFYIKIIVNRDIYTRKIVIK